MYYVYFKKLQNDRISGYSCRHTLLCKLRKMCFVSDTSPVSTPNNRHQQRLLLNWRRAGADFATNPISLETRNTVVNRIQFQNQMRFAAKQNAALHYISMFRKGKKSFLPRFRSFSLHFSRLKSAGTFPAILVWRSNLGLSPTTFSLCLNIDAKSFSLILRSCSYYGQRWPKAA